MQTQQMQVNKPLSAEQKLIIIDQKLAEFEKYLEQQSQDFEGVQQKNAPNRNRRTTNFEV